MQILQQDQHLGKSFYDCLFISSKKRWNHFVYLKKSNITLEFCYQGDSKRATIQMKIFLFYFRNDDDYDYSAREDAAESGLIRAKSPLQYYK